MKIKWRGYVDNGKLQILNRDEFIETVRMFSGDVFIIIHDKREQRSQQQNKYWWGVVVPKVREGLEAKGEFYTDEEVHEALKWKFLKNHEDSVELPSVRSTADLDTLEFQEKLVQPTQRWASEFLGTYIPDPNQDFLMEGE